LKNKLILFDLDGTLFNGNSTYDFIKYVNSDNEEYIKFKQQYKYMRFYNKISFTIFKYDWYKKRSVSFLKGKSYLELEEFADKFYIDILDKNRIENILSLMKFYQSQDADIGIITATLDIIAKTVAKKLDIDYHYSTPLVYDKDSIATGKYERDLLHNKLSIYNDKIKPIYKEVILFSDNEQDTKLLNKVTVGFKIYGTT